ncbi:hypothetical protein BLOT_009551 [Blomia tropicalis]|nr:hypothetical protein BLOT_009551 [Blomia tropicalis]
MKFIYCFIALSIIFNVCHSQEQGTFVNPDQVCQANEEYTSCGSSCPDTCDTILSPNPGPRACNMKCVPGCFCKQNFVRDVATDKCIHTFECKKGGDNREFAGGGALSSRLSWLLSLPIMIIMLVRLF